MTDEHHTTASTEHRRIPPEWSSSRPRAQRARAVADTLRRRIAAGDFTDGVLPDEHELATDLNASRNAVREALGLLREDGLVVRRRGVGTLVATPTYGHGLDRLSGLAEELAGHGTVTNEVLVAEQVARPPSDVLRRLSLADDSSAVHIERVRRVEGEAISWDSTYLPSDIGSGVLDADLTTRDVFAVLEETTGQPLGHAEVEVRAATADAETATMLEIDQGAAIFLIDRLTRLPDDTPVDVELLRVRADRMTLRATLYRGLPS